MRLPKKALPVLLLPALLTIQSCDEGSGPEASVVRDSAGVTIVENFGGAWEEGQEWITTSAPTLNIGVLDGAPEYQLFRVRNALRLGNGHIVVAASNELRFYDAEGRYLQTSGREGGGPGEFQQLGWVRPYPGDSIVAYDFGQVRVSLLDAAGEFGRSYRIVPDGEQSFVMGENVFADGTILVKAPLIFSGGFDEGSSRNDEDFHTYSTTGEFIDSVATLPGPDQFIQTGGDSERRFVSISQPPFGRESVMDLFESSFYFGSSDTYEIELHSQDGKLHRLIRKNFTPRRVTDDDIAAHIERELAEADDDDERRRRRQAFDDMPVPETMPAYSDLKVDELGNVWVRDFEPDEDAASVWTVFNPDGQMLGSVTLAAGFNVNQIGDNYLLGVWRDEYDVEHIHMYGLIKPGREGV